MGLYFNEEDHYIFKSDEVMDEPNQSVAHINEWTKFRKVQESINGRLRDSFLDIKKMVDVQERARRNQWKKISYQLKDLQRINRRHEEAHAEVKSQVAEMDERAKSLEELLQQEKLFKQEVMEELQRVSKTNEEIEQRLTTAEALNKELLSKLNEQYELQKEMSGQMLQHEDQHQDIVTRLEKQEAVTDKILRQVTHIRSILFERAHFLAEKIEDSYQLTSSYVYKLMTGSVEPWQLFLMKQKQKQKKESE